MPPPPRPPRGGAPRPPGASAPRPPGADPMDAVGDAAGKAKKAFSSFASKVKKDISSATSRSPSPSPGGSPKTKPTPNKWKQGNNNNKSSGASWNRGTSKSTSKPSSRPPLPNSKPNPKPKKWGSSTTTPSWVKNKNNNEAPPHPPQSTTGSAKGPSEFKNLKKGKNTSTAPKKKWGAKKNNYSYDAGAGSKNIYNIGAPPTPPRPPGSSAPSLPGKPSSKAPQPGAMGGPPPVPPHLRTGRSISEVPLAKPSYGDSDEKQENSGPKWKWKNKAKTSSASAAGALGPRDMTYSNASVSSIGSVASNDSFTGGGSGPSWKRNPKPPGAAPSVPNRAPPRPGMAPPAPGGGVPSFSAKKYPGKNEIVDEDTRARRLSQPLIQGVDPETAKKQARGYFGMKKIDFVGGQRGAGKTLSGAGTLLIKPTPKAKGWIYAKSGMYPVLYDANQDLIHSKEPVKEGGPCLFDSVDGINAIHIRMLNKLDDQALKECLTEEGQTRYSANYYIEGTKFSFAGTLTNNDFNQVKSGNTQEILNLTESTLNAFVNTQGGTLYIGIGKDYTVYGVSMSKQEIDALQKKLEDQVRGFTPKDDLVSKLQIGFIPVVKTDGTFVRNTSVIRCTIPGPLYDANGNKKTFLTAKGEKYRKQLSYVVQMMG